MNKKMRKTVASSRVIWSWWYLILCAILIMAVSGCVETKILRQLPMVNTIEEVSLSPEQEKLASIVANTEIDEINQILLNSGALYKKATIFLRILNKNPSQNFLANFKQENITLKPASLGLWQEDSAYDPQDKNAHTYFISIATIEINDRTDTAQLYVIYGH